MKLKQKLACFVLLAVLTGIGIGGTSKVEASQYIQVAKASGILSNGQQFGVSAVYGPRGYEGSIVVTSGRYVVLKAYVECVDLYSNYAAVVGRVTNSQYGYTGQDVTFYLYDGGTPNRGYDSAKYYTNYYDCSGVDAYYDFNYYYGFPYIYRGEVLVNRT
jgi:hypothetical protein